MCCQNFESHPSSGNSFNLLGQLKLTAQLLNHGLKLLVGAFGVAHANVRHGRSVVEPLKLPLCSEARPNQIDGRTQLLGFLYFPRSLKERHRVTTSNIKIMHLSLNLFGVYYRNQKQWGIHYSPDLRGQILTREIKQSIQCKHRSIFISITIPTLGRMPDRMCVAHIQPCEAYDSANYPDTSVRSKTNNQMSN